MMCFWLHTAGICLSTLYPDKKVTSQKKKKKKKKLAELKAQAILTSGGRHGVTQSLIVLC